MHFIPCFEEAMTRFAVDARRLRQALLFIFCVYL